MARPLAVCHIKIYNSQHMKLLTRFLDSAINVFSFFGSVLLVLVMLLVVTDVVLRYFFNRPLLWVFDVTEYSLVFITFLAAAWLLKKESYVVMDFLLIRLSQKTQAVVNTVTSVISALVCLVLVWYGTDVTLDLFRLGIREQTQLRAPSFALYAIIPIGSLLLFAQFLRKTRGEMSHLKTLRNKSGNVQKN
ncbi:MAG: TRAP transporter small permease [Chloroflexi bacterium]|nr:TRAP transporter small permease [Chloroflexota bacterium]